MLSRAMGLLFNMTLVEDEEDEEIKKQMEDDAEQQLEARKKLRREVD